MHEDRSDENHLYEDSRDDDGSTAAACSAVHIDGVVCASRRSRIEGSSGGGAIQAYASWILAVGDNVDRAKNGQTSIPSSIACATEHVRAVDARSGPSGDGHVEESIGIVHQDLQLCIGKAAQIIVGGRSAGGDCIDGIALAEGV